jgi:hypothetical protein
MTVSSATAYQSRHCSAAPGPPVTMKALREDRRLRRRRRRVLLTSREPHSFGSPNESPEKPNHTRFQLSAAN